MLFGFGAMQHVVEIQPDTVNSVSQLTSSTYQS